VTQSIASIARAIHGNLSRNELKVVRERLRRMGLTNLNTGTHASGPYTINTSADVVSDARTVDAGTVLVAAIAEAA
jgi:hypothetical protein